MKLKLEYAILLIKAVELDIKYAGTFSNCKRKLLILKI